MLSKLQIYCEAIMEAAWLAAAAAIPLFFNISSTQIFEPDKVFVLRFLAVISGAACLLKWLAANRPKQNAAAGERLFRSLLRHPLALLVVALAVIYTLSSIFSIMPALSWLGLYGRAQGTITFYCYVTLFLVVLSELRSSAQLRRLQYVFILTSLPVAGYGILQHFGVDSLPWSNAMRGRSSGSMGNPIFLGAYLAMVIPLTFGRLVDAIRMLRAESNRKPALILAGSCGLALALQGLALFYTQSRGPVIGLAVSGYICLFIFLVLKRTPGNERFIFPAIAAGVGIAAPVLAVLIIRMTSGSGMMISAVCLGTALVCIAIAYWVIWRLPWGRNWLWLTWLVQTAALIFIFSVLPMRILAENRMFASIGRLTQLSNNSVDVRRFLWQTGIRAVKSGSPPVMQDNTRDVFRYLRPVIGYGPENTWFVANSYANPELVKLHTSESVDRMHNDTFDNLVTIGFAGAALWLALIGAAVYHALKFLGFPGRGGWKNPFISFSAVGSIAGVLLPWAAGYPYLMGIGVIAGMLAGVVAFAAWSGYRNLHAGFIGEDRQVFVFCILGALIAHFVEIGVGIAVTSTRIYFFILLALLTVFSVRDFSRAEAPIKQRVSKHVNRLKNPLLPLAVLSSFVVLVLSWCFVINTSDESHALALFFQTWFAGYSKLQFGLPVPGSLILLLLTIVGGIGLMYGEIAGQPMQKNSQWKRVAPPLSLMLSVWLVAGILSAAFWTASNASEPARVSVLAESRIAFFLIALCLLILAAAWRLVALDAARYATTVPVRARSAWLGILIAICGLGAIQELSMRPARADIVCRIAQFYERSGHIEAAIQLYKRASKLAPRVVPYWKPMGLAQNSAGRLEESLQSLQHAVDLNPLDPGIIRTLAGVYVQGAERSTEPAVRSRQISQAIALYQQAARLAPNYPDAYCELGRCYLLLGEREKAAGLYEKSLQINPHYARTYMFMGEMHYRLKDLERAQRDFEMAARLDRGNIEARKNHGFLLALLGRKEEAIRVDLNALKRAPQDLVLLRRLSALYFSQGDSVAGHAYARRAYDATPAAEKGTYEKFVADLQNQ